ncbi:response regulator [Halovenus salina]|uniref:Response regulator n=1 Tax=Halovenus salina TaxID=1510225 RepID=A0ABD5VXY0_9EURY|nr:response regulator [Halovenus salina]
MPAENATVLVVDDEQEVADVYALRLRNSFETRVAYSGNDALESMDVDVDVVLLDRRMPDISGDEVLEQIREKGYDCRVIMLTAVDPGLDIVDMPFDDYLCKPVEKDDLVGAIEQQLKVISHDDTLSEYFELTSKLALLESELSEEDAEDNEELQQLQQQVETLRAELDDALDGLDDIESSFAEISRQPGR